MPKREKHSVESLSDSIRASFEHWEEIRKKGCGDPFYPDGVNMNLIRNHIICDQGLLRDLCKANGFKCPFIARKHPPREVMDSFMSKGSRRKLR